MRLAERPHDLKLTVPTERLNTARRSNAKKICFFFNNRHGSTGFKIVDEPA